MKKILSASLVLSVMVTFVLLSIHVDVCEEIMSKMNLSPPAYAAGETASWVSPDASHQHDHGEMAPIVNYRSHAPAWEREAGTLQRCDRRGR